MDFKSILAAEIASKKRKLESTANSSTSSESKPSKYLKRSELEAQRQKEYLEEQERREKERQERAERKRREEEEERERRERQKEKLKAIEERKRAEKEKEEGKSEPEDGGLSKEELDEKFRELKEPIRIFGEDEPARRKRLQRTLAERESKERNVIPTMTLEEMLLDLADVQRNPAKLYTQLTAWFHLVLQEWEIALAARPREVAESYQGRAAYGSFTQAREHMKPLFEKFRRKDLDEEVFAKVCEIVRKAQERRYVDANDVYLRLSIGNA